MIGKAGVTAQLPRLTFKKKKPWTSDDLHYHLHPFRRHRRLEKDEFVDTLLQIDFFQHVMPLLHVRTAFALSSRDIRLVSLDSFYLFIFFRVFPMGKPAPRAAADWKCVKPLPSSPQGWG